MVEKFEKKFLGTWWVNVRIGRAGQVGQRVEIRIHVKMDSLTSHSYVRNDLSV
jgi:hypothetical protein